MSAGFRAVQCNRANLVYHGILLAGVVLYIGAYLTLVYWLAPPKDQPAAIDLRIRAFGTCAFFMLTMILSIGPLTRLDRRLPPVWKGLHMALYVAYGLVVMHVALGVMQYDHNPFIPAMLASGFACVTMLHLVAGWRERGGDCAGARGSEGWLSVGPPLSIPDKGARIVAAPDGERIAVFRDGAQIGALSNLCAHQHGPIGEGRIIDGCVTCPWHGYQYRLKDGCAPPPFTEKLVTYRVRVAHGVVEVPKDH